MEVIKESKNPIVLYEDVQLELHSTRKTVERYVRNGLLARALLPGFKRARGITRKSLDALLEKISNAPLQEQNNSNKQQ